MKNKKDIIRKEILRLRNLINGEELEEKSSAIMRRLMDTEEFKASKTIMCYMDFKNEVKTVDFMKLCLMLRKRVAVPLVQKIEGGRKELIACEVRDLDSELEPGTYGILEPRKDAVREVPPDEIDLVVVPGVVFDLKKNRIGYGAGYYDRFLKKTRNDCSRIAVAFDIQIVDEVPVEGHDEQMGMIITESRII